MTERKDVLWVASRKGWRGGFTMIDMLISIGIFTLISSLIVVNYSGYNSHLSVDFLAQQMSQWIRDAQVSAMGVRHTTNVTVFPGYGIHFDKNTPGQFVYFADLDRSRTYAALDGAKAERCGGVSVECERVIPLTQGVTITKICVQGAPGAQGDCPQLYAPVTSLDIVFTRPNPDAVINNDMAMASARVTVSAPAGYSRTIETWVTGQISVQ